MNKMTIKMFAELTNSSVDTLKHYDRVGLLKPASVDVQNSYRYYTADQAIPLSKIKYFRSMEVPIPKIKEYMDNLNVDLSMELIDNRVVALKEQIEQCETQITALSRRKHYLSLVKQAKLRIDMLDINLFGDRYYYSQGRLDRTIEEATSTVVEMTSALEEDNIRPFFRQYGFIIPKDDLVAQKVRPEYISFIFVEENYLRTAVNVYKAESGYYLCGYHKGSVAKREKVLNKMMQYIKDEGYKVTGPALLVNLADENDTAEESDFLYQFQIPVDINKQ